MSGSNKASIAELVGRIVAIVPGDRVMAMTSTMAAAALVAVCHGVDDGHAVEVFERALQEARLADAAAARAADGRGGPH